MNRQAKMFSFAMLVFLAQLAHAGEKPLRDRPYVLCNVFLPDTCFGIGVGDELTMKIISDFVLYKITFSSGGNGIVYYGFNPQFTKGETTEFSPCERSNGFDDCKRRNLASGGVEMVARRDKSANFVHVLLEPSRSSMSHIESFLSNFRACTKTGEAIACEP